MPTDEDIAAQQALLQAHRQTLNVLLTQQAQLGAAYAPPAIANGIRVARGAVAQIKRTLREWGVSVDDLPNDVDFAATLDDVTPRVGPGAPALGGDNIVTAIGAGAQGNVVGKNQFVHQTIVGGPADADADRRAIELLLARLESDLAASAGQLDGATSMMAAFQLRLLAGELGKTGERASPSASTITQVGDWLLDNLRPLHGALAALFTAPPVLRALHRADAPLDAWLQRRLGT
jgi:hypothetical protein